MAYSISDIGVLQELLRLIHRTFDAIPEDAKEKPAVEQAMQILYNQQKEIEGILSNLLEQ